MVDGLNFTFFQLSDLHSVKKVSSFMMEVTAVLWLAILLWHENKNNSVPASGLNPKLSFLPSNTSTNQPSDTPTMS